MMTGMGMLDVGWRMILPDRGRRLKVAATKTSLRKSVAKACRKWSMSQGWLTLVEPGRGLERPRPGKGSRPAADHAEGLQQ